MLEPEPGKLVYQIGAGNWTFALVLEGLEPVMLVRLPDTPTLSELSCSGGRYTLPQKDRVLVYDREFCLTGEFSFPEIVTHNDGGVFPIHSFSGGVPRHAHLSPDGKWVLFDCDTILLLMDLDTGELRYAVWCNTFTSSTRSGFLDDRHIWYNWADSTYIMEI